MAIRAPDGANKALNINSLFSSIIMTTAIIITIVMIATLQDTDELLRSSEHHRPAGVRQEGNGLLPSLVSLCHRRHEHPAGD